MSRKDEPERPLSIEEFPKALRSPPKTESDRHTQQESTDLDLDHAERLSRSAGARSIYFAEREHDDLRRQRDRFEQRCDDLRERLDEVVPKYRELHQAYNDSRGNLGLSTLFLSIGSIAVSVAGSGAIPDGVWKSILIWGGLSVSLCGLILALWTLVSVRPSP